MGLIKMLYWHFLKRFYQYYIVVSIKDGRKTFYKSTSCYIPHRLKSAMALGTLKMNLFQHFIKEKIISDPNAKIIIISWRKLWSVWGEATVCKMLKIEEEFKKKIEEDIDKNKK